MLNPFGPMRFDRSPHAEWDAPYIPAIPGNPPPDPAQRDNQFRRKPQDWINAGPRWTFNKTSGDLISRAYMENLEPAEINGFLSEAIKYYGEAVKRIVLRLNPDMLDQHYWILRKRGFDRCTALEVGDAPEIIYTGPPTPWK